MPTPVVTRFAPSPTGHLHIGGARTALFCWAYARRHGGSFLIRIEDTDQARSSEASARGILEDLAWLGINWDEGPVLPSAGLGGDPRHVEPFFQSQRLPIYNRIIDEMIDKGTAYADFSPADKLDAMRKAATAAKQTFRYRPDAGEILPPVEQRRRIAAGEPHVVRLRPPEEAIHVVDEVLGDVSFAAGEVDDFVLRKADGFPTYHFGVVVDDELMGVTHVLRGQEHLMNTPKHVMLQKVLGYRVPTYAHMPLIFNDQGAKMSKRERDQTARAAVKQKGVKESPISAIDATTFEGWLADTKRQLETGQLEALAEHMGLSLPEVSVEDFRKAGYIPAAINNFIALLGWNPGLKNADGTDLDRFDMGFLSQNFDVQRIGKSNSRFDRKKLMAFNADALGAMTDADFLTAWRGWCERFAPQAAARLAEMGTQRATWLTRAVKPRCKTLRDALRPAAFAFTADGAIVFDEAAIKKVLHAPIGKDGGGPLGRDALGRIRAALETLPENAWEPATLNAAIEKVAADLARPIGEIAPPLRLALTGTTVSPGFGETLASLGRASVLARIARCSSLAG